MKCPHCSKDIAEKLVLQEAARIMGRRGGGRRKLTPEEAREMQRKGVEARKKRAAETTG